MGFNDVKVTAQQELFFMFMHFTWSEADRGGQSGAVEDFVRGGVTDKVRVK